MPMRALETFLEPRLQRPTAEDLPRQHRPTSARFGSMSFAKGEGKRLEEAAGKGKQGAKGKGKGKGKKGGKDQHNSPKHWQAFLH